jgi:hypothetical protein
MSNMSGRYSTAEETPSDDLSGLWTAFVVLILITTLVLIRFICCGNCPINENALDDEFFLMNDNQEERMSPEQQLRFLEKRRELIMKCIVQKVSSREMWRTRLVKILSLRSLALFSNECKPISIESDTENRQCRNVTPSRKRAFQEVDNRNHRRHRGRKKRSEFNFRFICI